MNMRYILWSKDQKSYNHFYCQRCGSSVCQYKYTDLSIQSKRAKAAKIFHLVSYAVHTYVSSKLRAIYHSSRSWVCRVLSHLSLSAFSFAIRFLTRRMNINWAAAHCVCAFEHALWERYGIKHKTYYSTYGRHGGVYLNQPESYRR